VVAAVNLEAERLRRLAVIVAAEREITTATRSAYAELLRLIAADVLDGKAPIVAALPETNRNRNQVNVAWLLLLARVRKPILKLFRSRFLSSGATNLATAEAAYIAAITMHLKAVPTEVYTELDKIVANGVRAGLSEAEIKDSLARELQPGHPEYEARLDRVSNRVGRSQGPAAFNAGEDAGWRNVAATQGSKLTKTWLTAGDSRVRLWHVEAEGQTVAADQHFEVGGEQAMYPGDPSLSPENSVGCRCTAVYSTNAIIASGGPAVTNQILPDGWRGPVAALDCETGDKRILMTPPDGLKTRAYPLSLTLGHVGEEQVPIIGSIDRVWAENGEMYGEGKLDLGGEAGAEFARQLVEGYTNSVSIHPADVTAEIQMVLADGTVLVGQDAQDAYDEAGGMPEGSHDRMAMTNWVLAGLAAVPIPAYTQARIEPVFDYVPSEPSKTDAKVVLQEGVVASVGGQVFHRAFFEAKATGPTKLTVTDDGHVYGHIREYGTCYQYGSGQGDGGYCVEPPLSACNYAKFHAHSAKLDDGSIIDVGALTFGEGHESRGGLLASRRHYDDVATMAAKVVASEDEWGVFITGEVLDAYRDTAYDLLLSPLSGHWEPDADNKNHLEMLAVHIVVTPGYSVGRIVASFDEGTEPSAIVVTTYPSQKGSAFGTLMTSGQRANTSRRTSPSTRALVAAAMADHARAAKLAKRAGVDPASRVERMMERIGR
jgi:hypothetical protein